MTDGSNRGVSGQEAEPLDFPSTSETKPANRLQDARTGWFEALLAIQKNGSFAGASKTLGVTDKAVRDLINEFQKWSGLKLITVHARGSKPSVTLTKTAERLSPKLQQIIGLTEAIRAFTL